MALERSNFRSIPFFSVTDNTIKNNGTQGILYRTRDPKLKEDNPTNIEKSNVKSKKLSSNLSLIIYLIVLNGPVLNKTYKVNSRINVDSRAEKNMIIFLPSHINSVIFAFDRFRKAAGKTQP